MELVSYIDKEYFDEIDFTSLSPFKNNDDVINAENIKLSIRATLMASKIKTNLSNKECIKYFKRVQDETIIPSWKEQIIFQAIRNKEFEQISQIQQSDKNAIYFLKENSFAHSNKMIISDFHNKIYYYENLNNRYDIDKNMNDISVLKHEANSVIIADPYIFSDTPGLMQKMPNIIKFLKEIFTIPNEKYHLSFIGRNVNDNINVLVENKFTDIKEAFPDYCIDITGFFPKKDIFEADRYIFTNYCMCDYSHLFDRNTGIRPTCLFVHHTGNVQNRLENIKTNYLSINSKLNKIKTIFSAQPENFGTIKIKFGNILNNPIFK